MKSYTVHAIVVLLLYFVLFIPGLIANEIWYREAKRMEKIAGQELPGVGALTVLRKIMMAIMLLVCIGLVVVVIFGILSILTNPYA